MRHCIASCEVAGSISDEVLPVGLCPWGGGSTQPLSKISTRNISWGINAAGACGWLSYLHTSCASCLEIGDPQRLEPKMPVEGLLYLFLLQNVLELHSPWRWKQDVAPKWLKTHPLGHCFSTARPRPGTGPWHQLYRAARDSPGICHFSFLSNFHE